MPFEGEPLNVFIETGKRSDLLSSLIELRSNPKSSKVVSEQESKAFIFSSVTKTKKDKKKDKQKESKTISDVAFMRTAPTTIENDLGGGSSDEHNYGSRDPFAFLDAESYMREDDEEGTVTDSIINEERKKYKKRDNDIEKKFDPELTALYDLMDEVNKFGKLLEKDFDKARKSTVRGMSKFTNDLMISILSSKTSKLQVIKEIASIKKTMHEMKVKMDKEQNNSDDNNSPDKIAAAYLSQIANKVGRNNFINDMAGGTPSFTADSVSGLSDAFHSSVDELDNRIDRRRDDMDDDRFFDLIHDRLESNREQEDTNNGSFRSEEADIYLKYENRGINIAVKHCIDRDTSHFIAVDRDGVEVSEYPTPNIDRVGPLRFSPDGKRATDKLGMSYKVFEYYSSDEY